MVYLLRLTHFVFQLFMLIFLALGSIQALDLKGNATTTRKNTTSDGNAIMWDELSFNRKLLMMKLDQVFNTEEALKISGATKSAEKSNLKAKHELRTKPSKLAMRSRKVRPMNVKMGNFMVFNSDYHIPRPHPPKNN